VDLYSNRETFEAAGLKGHRVHVLEDRTAGRIGAFWVLPLSVEHDVPTFSYLVSSGNEKLLYITDAEYFPYKVDGITRLMIEANHDTDVVKENVEKGFLNEALAKHIVRSHMSIRSCLTLIEKMDKSRLEEIWLLHLSSDNSRADEFLRRVRAMTGCVVHVA
jgi:phosphoribosyl 1,2-cyclic phosphodiesterase